jgi:hypothetical protein
VAARSGAELIPFRSSERADRAIDNDRKEPWRSRYGKGTKDAMPDSNCAINEARSTGDAASIYSDGTYLSAHSTWHVEDSPWKAKQIHTILSRNGIAPNTICEVGCGAGEILKQLSLKMPDARYFGYEMSRQAFSLCQTRASEKLQYFLKNVLDEEVHFDVLLCIDVFEHVEDYMGFIKALRAKATYKVFHIPLDISVLSVLRNSMLEQRQCAGHLHYFTPATAMATLKDSGYKIIDSFYTPAFDDLPSKTTKARLARIPRKLLFAASPDLMIKLLGGCSLLVLTN